MSGTKREVFEAEFKAKVRLEEIHGAKTINQIAPTTRLISVLTDGPTVQQ